MVNNHGESYHSTWKNSLNGNIIQRCHMIADDNLIFHKIESRVMLGKFVSNLTWKIQYWQQSLGASSP